MLVVVGVSCYTAPFISRPVLLNFVCNIKFVWMKLDVSTWFDARTFQCVASLWFQILLPLTVNLRLVACDRLLECQKNGPRQAKMITAQIEYMRLSSRSSFPPETTVSQFSVNVGLCSAILD